ncbi:MAG: AAA family ATPase [Rhodobacteraceae bacterium]|nr:AAA family ATPase [Paracoccaceae bacterium]
MAKFKIKNFGPIAEGAVDLRPLTVFTGPSNTGKSWLATLIYAMEKQLNGLSSLGFRFALRRQSERHNRPFPENPNAWLESLQHDQMVQLTDSDQKIFESAFRGTQEELKDGLLSCFGMSKPGHLVREGVEPLARISIDYGDATRPLLRSQDVKITQAGKISIDAKAAETWHLSFPTPPHLKEGVRKELEDAMNSLEGAVLSIDTEAGNRIAPSVMSLLRRFLYTPDSFYLPADRGGVMHAHQVVVSTLIQNASRAGIGGGSSLPALSGVLTDFLKNLVDLADSSGGMGYGARERRGPGKDMATRLESNILNGKITVERTDVSYPRFTYTPEGWDKPRSLPLVNVSSMVSELAPVALYLRHYVRPGDLLILEEPEAHLHPAMQVAFAREIAGWVRHGVRVLLTTHSEWVLEEIANLVAAGDAGESAAVSPDDAMLSPDDVGVWLFESPQDASTGTRIHEMPWDADQGGYASDFDSVAQDLHNRWADIINGTP